jgi:RNase P/RNase MRP subunit POP5
MVVKSKRGRVRYIAFDVPGDLKKEALIKNLRSIASEAPPYVIQCAFGKAIMRCAPKDREETVRIMSRIDPSCISLMTSGTIRKIRDRYPELKTAKR